MANNVVNLVWKDFRAVWSEKSMGPMFLILLVISGIFASYLTISSLFFVMLTVFNYTLNVFSLEEKFRTEKFFASLPVRRKDIVIARYLEILAIAGVYFVVAYLSNACILFMRKPGFRPIPLGYCAAVLVVLTFATSFTFPFYFKFGFAKAKAVTTGLFAVFTAMAVTSAAARSSSSGGSYWVAKAISAVLNSPFPHDLLQIIITIALAVLLWGLSIPVAVSIYSKKDF